VDCNNFLKVKAYVLPLLTSQLAEVEMIEISLTYVELISLTNSNFDQRESIDLIRRINVYDLTET
jgi:hypothetical protein